MSGGVDSSVVAALLKEQGHDLIGIFMHFWAEPGVENDSGINNKCCSLESFNDARRVAQKLGFPIYTINLDEPFKKKVVDDFLAGYQNGRTPNPCINCNKHIKFDLLLKKADDLGVDYIATGHYAKINYQLSINNYELKNKNTRASGGKQKNFYKLFRPKDLNKDQTYFLHTLNQKKLARVLFPLSDLTKPQVRELAKKYGLEVAEKRESQEICFIPEKNHNDFLKRHLKLKPGDIKTLDDKVVGTHQGLPLYTIGQRKGVEIGGIGPFYVSSLDYETNTLYVVADGEDPSIFKDELIAKEVNWISGVEPTLPFECEAVIRYRHQPVKCTITKAPLIKGDRGIESELNPLNPPCQGDKYKVKFDQPQRAITAGQSVVFYNEDEVLGGGVIN